MDVDIRRKDVGGVLSRPREETEDNGRDAAAEEDIRGNV